MSRFTLSAANGSSILMKSGKSEFQIKNTSLELPSPDSKLSDPDVSFRVGCDTFHGHQQIFQSMSSQLKRCFEFSCNGCTPLQLGGVLKITKTGKSGLTITIDANEDTFNYLFDYCYGCTLTVPVTKLPPLYLLAKRLDVPTLLVPCADFLSQHITLEVIGELSRFVEFSVLEHRGTPNGSAHQDPTNESTAAELRLASAVREFLHQKADLVASSSTRQLGARLLVNLTIDPPASPSGSRGCLQNGDTSGSREDNLVSTYPSQIIAFALLRWGHERVVLGERLARSGSEENVLSDDEDSEVSGGHSNAVSISDLSQQLPDRIADPVGKRRYHSGGGGGCSAGFLNCPADGQTAQLKLENRNATDDDDNDIAMQWDRRKVKHQRSTQDVRIALQMKELEPFLIDAANGGVTNGALQDHCSGDRSTFQLRSYCPKDGGAEMETCLLAPTGLGAGATSIWLGKLAGQLVSLSLKFYRPSSPPGSIWNHSGGCQPLRDSHQYSCNSSSSDLSCPNVCLDGNSHAQTCGDEVAFTMTPTSANHLARAAAVSVSSLSVTSSADQGVDGDWLPQEGSSPGVPIRMTEARSGAGAGLLCSEEAGSQPYLLVVGGYTRKGCLDTVELFTPQTEVTDSVSDVGLLYPSPGPVLSRLRGRLAVATTSEDSSISADAIGPNVMYACGGSNGSVDLASVERLTSKSFGDWLTATAATTNSVHVKEPTRLMPPPWKPVHRMRQSRSSPCAVGLSGGIPGSILVAGGVAGCTPLASVECFVAERDEWIMLPDMLEARCEATCSLLPSRQLVVVAGGTAVNPGVGNISGCPKSTFVEALDLRCSQWISLPSLPNSGGLRGSCLVLSPTHQDGLLMVGGFNGRDTVDTVWYFDAAAWQWYPYTSLVTARSSACAVTWPDRSGTVVIGGFNAMASASGFLDSVELLRSIPS